MEIASLIVAIAKAIPAFDNIYQRSVELYYAREQKSDDAQVDEIQQEREAIAASLKQPGMTDANRNILRKRLITLSRL